MNRYELEKYIEETYCVTGECLWERHPTDKVYRHSDNRKWFAVFMEISKKKLGLIDSGHIQVVNLKCDPLLIGSFRLETGIYSAYHMSKAHWLTVALDGTVDDDKLRFLLDMSYDLTK